MVKPRNFTERRRFLRLPLSIGIYYKAMEETLDTSGLRPSKAGNFSPGGIMFRSAFRMKAGTIIQMMLDFSHAGRRRRVPALAKVARCRPAGKRSFEIGAEYVEIFPRDLELITAVSAAASHRHGRKAKAAR